MLFHWVIAIVTTMMGYSIKFSLPHSAQMTGITIKGSPISGCGTKKPTFAESIWRSRLHASLGKPIVR
jgi:hypothetical protein